MPKSILTVLEGEGLDHPATQLALTWARESGALLAVLGVIDEAAVHPLEAVPVGAGQAKQALDAQRLADARRHVEQALSQFAVRCAQQQIACKPLEQVGHPAAVIAQEAQRYDLIVMPRDRRGAAHHGFSSELWQLLHIAPRPVVAVEQQSASGESVVIAYDGSLQAARCLQAFVALGLKSDAQWHVVSLAGDTVEAARTGQRAMDFLDHHGAPATLHSVAATGNVGRQLMETAGRLHAGLLVMGACGQPKLREFFLGSVTKTVLSHCSVPLLLYQ